MSDTLTYLGNKTIAATIPGVMAAVSIGQGELQTQISALANFRPAAASYPDLIALAEQTLNGLLASLALGITPPSIDAQLDIAAQALAVLRGKLDVILAFERASAAAGVEVFTYDGSAAGLSSAIIAATSSGLPSGGGPASHCNALVLATGASATASAMGQVFVQ